VIDLNTGEPVINPMTGAPITRTIAQDVCTRPDERLWVPVRGDPSVTFINVRTVAAPGGGMRRPLSCLDTSAHLATVPDSCTDQRITVRDFHSVSAPGFACRWDPTQCVNLPSEPFGIHLDQGCLDGSLPAPDCGTSAPYARLLLTHLSTGEVTHINAGAFDPTSTNSHIPNNEQVVLDVRAGLFPADASGNHGTFGIAPREPGNPGGWWYVTSRLNALVSMFRIADVNLILPGPQFGIGSGPFAIGEDQRDIVFDPCPDTQPGCRAFAVQNHPPSVYTLDTRLNPPNGPATGAPAGLPINAIVDIVDVCQGPARLALKRSHRLGPEGDVPVARLYVNCFASGQVLVIDPDAAMIVDGILVGRGANEMAFNFGWDEVLRRDLPEPAHRRGYVTNFLDMTISVIDLDPGSSTEDHVIGRIGITDPPRVQ
jgi:hypothetical protein